MKFSNITNHIRRKFFNIKYRNYFANEEIHTSFRCDNYLGFTFGKGVYIGPFCHFDALGGIKINDYAIIGPHVRILSYNHDFHSNQIPYGPRNLMRPVTIDKGCWIGMQALILPGAEVGEGSIIAAGSIVKGKIPPFSLVRPNYSDHEPLRVQKEQGKYYRAEHRNE